MRYKYRIVTDAYCGFEVQRAHYLLPFIWIQLNGINTSPSIEEAKKLIEADKFMLGKRSHVGEVVYTEQEKNLL